MSLADRETLLDGISRGLERLERTQADGIALAYVDVALLDSDGDVIIVAPLTFALRWVVLCLGSTEDTTDISTAAEAHVQKHEGPCVECRKIHYTPEGDR